MAFIDELLGKETDELPVYISGIVTDKKVNSDYYFLKGFVSYGESPLTAEALGLAISCYGSDRRENGALAISHPFNMCCAAIGYKIREDEILATILLHDLAEDYGQNTSTISESKAVRDAVRLMTISQNQYDHTKAQLKSRYFKSLLDSPIALICKAFDRADNLRDMNTINFDRNRALKNWRETRYLLMPMLNNGKMRYTKYSDIFHLLRRELGYAMHALMIQFEFTDEEMSAPYGTMDFEMKPLDAPPEEAKDQK